MTKHIILLLIAVSSALAQGTPPVTQTNIVRLETAKLVWDANAEPDIAGYWVEMLTGGPVVKRFTTNTFMEVLVLRPDTTNGVHTFRVRATNFLGLVSLPAEVSGPIGKPPIIVLNLRLESSGGSATATATATLNTP